MSQFHPKVSICIPTYNRAWCLRETVNCALGQVADVPYEVFILDNASMDETPTLIQSYTDPRIRYERNPTTIGIFDNWNRCLELARGEYATIWADDDLIAPDFVSEHVAVLDGNPDVGLTYSACQLATMDGKVFKEFWPFPHSHVWTSDQELEFITRRNYIQCSPMIRRQHLSRVGLFNTQMSGCWNDWEFWLRFACYESVAYIAKILYTKRFHSRQASGVMTAEFDRVSASKAMDEWYSMVENVLQHTPSIERRRAKVLNARRYSEIAKAEVQSALFALHQRNLGEFKSALGRARHWQIEKAGWQYVPQTLWDAVMLLRKRWQGRTKYVFDIE